MQPRQARLHCSGGVMILTGKTCQRISATSHWSNGELTTSHANSVKPVGMTALHLLRPSVITPPTRGGFTTCLAMSQSGVVIGRQVMSPNNSPTRKARHRGKTASSGVAVGMRILLFADHRIAVRCDLIGQAQRLVFAWSVKSSDLICICRCISNTQYCSYFSRHVHNTYGNGISVISKGNDIVVSSDLRFTSSVGL